MKIKSVPTGMPEKSKKKRIEYWPELPEAPVPETPPPNWRVNRAVRWALMKLSFMEKETVERFYCCGQGCAEIGAELGLSEQRVYDVLKQARHKLKRLLGPFVQKRYGIAVESGCCQLCLSPHREAIEKLLKTKTKEETWRKILRQLKNEFKIRVGPRGLARHWQKHRRRFPGRIGGRGAGKKSGTNTP